MLLINYVTEKGLAVSWSLNEEIVVNENFIDGEWVSALSGKTLDVINPNNEELITKVPACDEKDVQKAALAAKKASFEWGRTPPKERGDMMISLAERLMNDIENLAKLETIN